jgi:methionine--tRNA ligase beta chain
LFPRPTGGTGTPGTGLASPAGPGAPPLAGRAGRIQKVGVHPSADKLYILEVDVGESNPRTVVAGLRPSYRPEQLVGRPVVLLANLAPRTIRRMTSQGMILCAELPDRAVLVAPPESVPVGTYLEGRGPTDRTISFDEFAAIPLLVGRIVGPAPGGGQLADIGGRTITVSGDWGEGSIGVARLPEEGANVAEWLAFGPGLPATPSESVAAGAKVR